MKILRFIFITIMFTTLVSCTQQNEHIIYGNGDRLLNSIEFYFNQDEFEREKYFDNNVYSSSSYFLSMNTKDFSDIKNVQLVLESINNPENIRVPIFKNENGNSTYKKTIQLEEKQNYEIIIDYYAIHRYENNDWNGDIQISLLYTKDGKSIKEVLKTYTLSEPSVPTEFTTFYEAWDYYIEDEYKVNYDEQLNTATLDAKWKKGVDNRPTFKVFYKVTRIFNSYRSKIKNDEYNNGYVSYVVEIITYYDEDGASWADSMKGKKIYCESINNMNSEELAIKAWRSGTTILEVNETNKNLEFLNDIVINCYLYDTLNNEEINVEVNFDIDLKNEYLYSTEKINSMNDYGMKITKTKPLYNFDKVELSADYKLYIEPLVEDITLEVIKTSDIYDIKGINDTTIDRFASKYGLD